ncbi:MAG: ExeM/NucH family extracellular endonuclease [Ilumatobacter sp.]|nr:ExeM/NucH family extracellular endonuclease [Ilumatobacter sp.]
MSRRTARTTPTAALRKLAVAAALAVPLVATAPAAVTAAGPTVFINEIHYDNTGTDAGEAIEVAGPAGTDLTGWSIVLYNGSNQMTYNTSALSGTIPNQQAGFGTVVVSYPVNGIQNGPADGIALVDGGATVVEFLSYEGSLTAVDGPASGMTSVDIGVSESSATLVGESLQLVGSGSMGGDFSWAAAQPHTFGAVNTGQTFSSSGPPAPGVGDLVVNEIDYDQPGTDTAEFVEIKNTTTGTLDLTGVDLVLVNGSGGGATIYQTIAMSGTLTAGDYLVVCSNFATVVNCDNDAVSSIQNGAPDAVAIVLGSTVLDTVSYEGNTGAPYTEGSGSGLEDDSDAGESISRCDDGVDTNQNNVDFAGSRPITPGATNDCEIPPPTIEFIHDVQGSGSSVAITGDVTVQGIVTALFERDDALDAFFLQEEDLDADLDPSTSEGIYVFCRGGCPAVSAGDQVTVTGEAEEFFGMSQIDMAFGSGTAVIESSGNPLPTAVAVDLPASGSTVDEATFENIEGMLAAFTDTLVVSEYFQLARFGQVVLTETDRPFQFTHLNAPSAAGYAAFLADLAARRIILDDDSNDNNDAIFDGPDEAYYYPEGGLSLGNKFRGGDTIDNLTGVMHWSFAGSSGTDAWRIRPIPSAFDYTFTSVNPEPAAPAAVGGSIQVASFNVLNYFTTIDVTSSGSSGDCGPSATQDCRGADSVAELDRQRAKIVAAMDELDADVIGVVEIQNDDDTSIADLVAGLNAVAGPGTYDYIATSFIGSDAIKVGLIYKPGTVSPLGDFAILDSSVDPAFIDTKNRPVLIQTFVENATDERFTVAVNHLKSKGSPCDDVGDPGLNDGQANCNLTRTSAAQALADYLATDPTNSDDPDFLIIGDLNAYAMEDPITALVNAGYTDLINAFQGSSAYSFVFDGQLGYLDHALANASLLPQITGVTEWHINADEINVFDYNDDIRDTPGEASFERETTVGPIYAPDALRSSDHDPLLVGLGLDSIPDNPTCNGLAATIVGTPGDDTIVGTNQADVIVTFGGDDTIIGGNGDDVICAGYGDDVVDGGNGKDLIFGEQGDDSLAGGNGKDALDGGAGADDGDGGNGKDSCVAIEVAVNCES